MTTPRPTSVRHVMIAATTLVAVMLYVDRVCLSILGEQIKPLLGDGADVQKLRFDDLQSAFFWAYALCQLPAGWLGDRYGPRVMLAVYLFGWSACTALMGLANGFAVLFVLRLGCGLFEAGAYPLAAGIVRRWMPFTVRGFASGCVAIGGRLGGAIAPPLTLFLAGTALVEPVMAVTGSVSGVSLADGWRTPFYVYGGIGMVAAVVFWFWFRNRPGDHPAVNAAEAELIANGQPPSAAPVGAPPFLGLVASPALWLCSLVQFLANFAWVFIITQFPSYLKEVFDTPAETRAQYQSFPLYAGIVGMLLGGWISDRLVRRIGLRWGRAVPIAASRLVVGAAYLGCLVLRDPLQVTVMMCLVAWATDIGTAPVWAYGQDVGGRHVGAVIGWANMWGNVGAAVAPMVLRRIQQGFPGSPTLGWDWAFVVCAATQLLAAAAALGINAAKPIRGAQ